MRGAIEVMKHMSEDGDMEAKKKMESIQEELKDKEEDLEDLELTNQALIVKERKNNDELQEARKELINVSLSYFILHYHSFISPIFCISFLFLFFSILVINQVTPCYC